MSITEPLAQGQIFKHRLRSRWVCVELITEIDVLARPVDDCGEPFPGRRSRITRRGDAGLSYYTRDRRAEHERATRQTATP